MFNLKSAKTVHELLIKHKVAPHKQLGQNFLIDQNALEAIANGVETKGKAILEIGPGLGTLTQQLATRANCVVAVEIDKGFLPILEETLAGFSNVQIVHEDIMKADLNILHQKLGGGAFNVCANLPYYITTPIIMRLFESDLPIDQMCFLIQKEVADRIGAQPGNKQYGSLSIAVQYYADIEVVAKVSPSCFIPPPKVESVAIRLTKRPPNIDLQDVHFFFQVTRGAFAMRRKTFANNIAAMFAQIKREDVQEMLLNEGIRPDIRAEALTLNQFARLSESLLKKMQNSE